MQPFNSERLSYRPYRRSDAEAAFGFFGDAEVMIYSAFGVRPAIERTVEMLAALIAPTVLATGWPETIAAVLTALAALRLPLIAVVAVGVVAAALLRMMAG